MRIKAIGLSFSMLAVFSMAVAQNQLFHSLGLGFNGGERQGDFSQPRMHVEGDKLYVCTYQGLFAKDLTVNNSSWLLAGFDGIALQDYARRGNDVLAFVNNSTPGLLLGHCHNFFMLLLLFLSKDHKKETCPKRTGHFDYIQSLSNLTPRQLPGRRRGARWARGRVSSWRS